MKIVICTLGLLIALFGFTPQMGEEASSLQNVEERQIDGIILEEKTQKPIVNAKVTLLSGPTTVSSTTTDSKGTFVIKGVEGRVTLQIAAKGFAQTKLIDVELEREKSLSLRLFLKPMIFSEDELITEYFNKGRHARSLASTTAKEVPESGDIHVRGERTKATDYFIDGIKVRDASSSDKKRTAKEPKILYSPETYEEVIVMDDASATPPPPPPVIEEVTDIAVEAVEAMPFSTLAGKTASISGSAPPSVKDIPLPDAGQLTAGEWKDLDNWTFWNKLMQDEYFHAMQDRWGFYPQNRHTVQLRGSSNQPLIDYPVALLKGTEIIWEGRTDNQGKAELWGHFFQKDQQDAFQIRLGVGDRAYTVDAKPYDSEINFYQLPVECQEHKQVDIAFVVDATGSMGDEINYLKAEVLDVMNRVKEENEEIELRLGSLFYRDVTDRYLTTSSPFTDEIEKTSTFINNQSAGGGGDYPEAVHTALHEAIHNFDWREEALSRIMFLILDAPPHQIDSVVQSIQKDVAIAAQKGIQIIPIAASGVNKKTEFLMKFLAMGTNGTYVFITDDSGIGNAHIKPEAKDYNVETLNDLMIRLILERVETAECIEQNIAQSPSIDEQIQTLNQTADSDGHLLGTSIQYFPNPATNYVRIQIEEAVDEMQILTFSGQVVRQLHNLQPGTEELQLNQLTAGTYILRFRQADRLTHKKLVVARI